MPVGEKEANELGIYDMSGNLYDWTNCVYGSLMVRRGGSWLNCSFVSETSYFFTISPSLGLNIIGFRLTRRP